MIQYSLSNIDIVAACDEAESFLLSCNVEPREILGIKIAFEDILLDYQENFGEAAKYSLKFSKRFFLPRMEFEMKGDSFNPFEKDGATIVNNILSSIGLAPSWSYRNGKNYLVITPKKRPLSDTKKMGMAFLLSIVFGFSMLVLPPDISESISSLFLTPMTDVFLGLISAVAAPLVFLSVLSSICSMGDVETLGKIGWKTVLAIIRYSLLLGILVFACLSPIYGISLRGASGSDLSQVLELFYGLVPDNLFEPFITGNVLQMIFIAILVGIAMLILSSKVSGIFALVEQMKYIVQAIMTIITSLLPFAVFLIFSDMFAGGNLGGIMDSWRMVLLIVLISVAIFTGFVLWVALRHRVSPIVLVKKLMPTLIICFTTASSSAALNTNMEDCHRRLGIDKKLIAFSIPLGEALLGPSVFIMLGVMEFSLCEMYGIEIALSTLLMMFLSNFLLSFADPPTAGGSLMSITIIFNQLGIPMEAIGIAIAISTMYDFLSTALDIGLLQLSTINIASKLNMIDKNVLRNKLLRR